jgi:hypothetical protein
MARSVEVAGLTIALPDPDAVADLSSRFQGMGDALADAAEQLAALASPQPVTPWTGGAADAFAQTIGPLPGCLGASRDAYHAAAAALSRYADQLRPVTAALVALAGQAADAVGELNATQAARDQVAQQDPLNPDLAGLDGQLANAHTAVNGLQAKARAQQSELEHLEAACAASVRQVTPVGHKPSLLGRLGRDLVDDVGKPLERGMNDLGQFEDKLIVKPFEDLGKDAWDFAEHPSWPSWRNLSKTLRDLTDVVGVLTMLVPPLDAVLAPVVLPAVVAAALLANDAALATGEISPEEGLGNALDEGLAGADWSIGQEIDAEKESLKAVGGADEAAGDGANAAGEAAGPAHAGEKPSAHATPSAPGPAGTGHAGQPATAPAEAGEPRSPHLDNLEKEQKWVKVGELVNTAVAPDDSGQQSSASHGAPAGASS